MNPSKGQKRQYTLYRLQQKVHTKVESKEKDCYRVEV